MAKHKKTIKVNIPLCIAGVLFCLTLLSAHFTSGLYARYTASSTYGDSARVIRFGDITIAESGDFGDDRKMMIIPGVDLTKKAVVNFEGSEASAYVFLEIILSSEWSTTDNTTYFVGSDDKKLMSWDLEEGWSFLETDNNGTYIYYRKLDPDTPLTADIISENGKVNVSNQITGSEISGMNDISIKFRATAIQGNGFKDAGEAWRFIAD